MKNQRCSSHLAIAHFLMPLPDVAFEKETLYGEGRNLKMIIFTIGVHV